VLPALLGPSVAVAFEAVPFAALEVTLAATELWSALSLPKPTDGGSTRRTVYTLLRKFVPSRQ
jgi:hypothetical protein